MIANHVRTPLVVAALALVALIARGETHDVCASTDAPATVHFLPGTALLVPRDVAWLASLRIPEQHRIVIASEQTLAEPADLAQQRVDAVADLLRDHAQIVVVTTAIEVVGEPPAPPTDDATVTIK